MSLRLAWKLLFAPGRLTTLLAVVAVGSIGLGVLVLTTVLAVMSGFEGVLSEKLVALGSELTITPPPGVNWRPLAARLGHQAGVRAVAPSLNGEALLLAGNRLAPMGIRGIEPAPEARVSDLGSHLVAGRLKALTPGGHGLIIGRALARELDLRLGSPVTLLTARAGQGNFTPRLSRYRIRGIYRIGIYEIERRMGYTDLADSKHLFPHAGPVGVVLRLDRPLAAPALAAGLRARLGPGYQVSDWTERQADLFATIGLEKRMVFVVLAAILAVAAFTVIATLVVSGLDREPEIAVLATLGFTPGAISRVFFLQGLMLGVVGTGIGLGLGAALALNVNRLLAGLDAAFHTRLLPPSVYLISELPARFQWQELAATAAVALGLTLVAAVYPALRGARISPAEALRHE